MSELATIKKTKLLITKHKLIEDLTLLGVKKGDTIIMHVSLSSIGWIVGGAVTLIEAVMSTIGTSGTLVMAAHTSDNSNPEDWENPPVPKEWIATIKNEMPAFDVDETPIRGIGVTCEVFRKFKGVKRSNHPQGSFCALGKHKNKITANHALSPQFGKESPLGVLYDLDAKILLIGVDYSSCTALHLAETIVAKTAMTNQETAMLVNGKRQWVSFKDYDYDVKNFNRLGKLFENKNKCDGFYVGQAPARLINMQKLVKFAVDFYQN